MVKLLWSLLLSIGISVLATALLRRALSAVSGPNDGSEGDPRRPSVNNPVVVVMPILVGNSGNRFLSPEMRPRGHRRQKWHQLRRH